MSITKLQALMPVKVLLIEDNLPDARLVEEIVRSSSSPVNVTTANNCSGALAILDEGRVAPNLVIADLDVLEFGGVELMKRCQPRGIPVVIFSGSMNPAHEAEVLRLGAKQFVRKPMQFDEYANAVWKIIADWARRSSRTAGTTRSSHSA